MKRTLAMLLAAVMVIFSTLRVSAVVTEITVATTEASPAIVSFTTISIVEKETAVAATAVIVAAVAKAIKMSSIIMELVFYTLLGRPRPPPEKIA